MDGGRTIPSDVNDPKYAAFYGPAQMQVQDGKDASGSNLAQDWTYVSPRTGMTGWRGQPKSSRNIILTSSSLTGGSVSPQSGRTWRSLRPTTTTNRARGSGGHHQL